MSPPRAVLLLPRQAPPPIMRTFSATLPRLHRSRSLKRREAAQRPNPRYRETHALAAGAADVLTPQMRMIVASWMVEACDEFALQPETLHLSVSLLDRFLSAAAPQGVPRGVLQMVAVAAIMVAAKDLEVGRAPGRACVLCGMCACVARPAQGRLQGNVACTQLQHCCGTNHMGPPSPQASPPQPLSPARRARATHR